jgi:hypothetical protein
VVGGGRDVGRPEVPLEVLGVPDGLGRSVALPVVVGSPVGVGWSRVVSGAGVVVGVVVSGAGAGVDAGTGLPAPLVAAPVVSGRMFRYSAKMARKRIPRTTVDVRARPRWAGIRDTCHGDRVVTSGVTVGCSLVGSLIAPPAPARPRSSAARRAAGAAL